MSAEELAEAPSEAVEIGGGSESSWGYIPGGGAPAWQESQAGFEGEDGWEQTSQMRMVETSPVTLATRRRQLQERRPHNIRPALGRWPQG